MITEEGDKWDRHRAQDGPPPIPILYSKREERVKDKISVKKQRKEEYDSCGFVCLWGEIREKRVYRHQGWGWSYSA
jgi:hypothetical protein